MAAPYRVLGVGHEATSKEIKDAYRKLALKLHPDRFVNAPPEQQRRAKVQFQEISSAFETLGDRE